MGTMRGEMGTLRGEMGALRDEMRTLQEEFSTRFTRLETILAEILARLPAPATQAPTSHGQ
jgi:hypothetical protein